MNRQSIKVALLVLSLLVHVDAFANFNKCQNLFLSNGVNSIGGPQSSAKDYFGQVISTKGLRFFLKSSQEDVNATKTFGLLSPNPSPGSWRYLRVLHTILNKPGSWVSSYFFNEPEYRFTPFAALYHWSFVAPVEWVSQKLTHQKKQLTIPVLLVASIVGGHLVQDASLELQEQKYTYEIQKEPRAFERLVKADYRYREINITNLKGPDYVQAIFEVQEARNQYFHYLSESRGRLNDLAWNETLLRHPYFIHLQNVMSNGVEPADGYVVPTESMKTLSNQQKIALFEVNHRLQLNLELLSELYNAKINKFEMSPDTPMKSKIWTQITNSDFAQQLLKLYSQGIIDDGTLLYRLQEDDFWITRFEEWKILGISRLKVDEVNQYTQERLSIYDIRRETLAEIANSHLPK